MQQEEPKSWIFRRYVNVTSLLKGWSNVASAVGWAIGAGAIFLVYPMAIGIIDERYLRKQGVKVE